MEISVTSIKSKSIAAKLRRATQTAIKKSLNKAGKEYKTFIVKRFRSQPPEWAPKKRPDGKSILVDTGRLRRDVTQMDMKLSGKTLKVSVKTPYAKFHQFGTSKMPKRTILVPPPKAILNKMIAILKKELVKNLR
jgi:HK97 gp10 family phage protein